jgi:hypothetical protein
MFASTKQMGTCTGGPDVCKTPMPPPVGQAPIPYPNMANCPMAMDPSTKVFISGSNALIQKSNFPTSNGDEAGAIGGVVSGKNMGKVEYLLGSMVVKIEGSNAMRMTSMTKHNDGNAPGTQLAPSQTKVMIMM